MNLTITLAEFLQTVTDSGLSLQGYIALYGRPVNVYLRTVEEEEWLFNETVSNRKLLSASVTHDGTDTDDISVKLYNGGIETVIALKAGETLNIGGDNTNIEKFGVVSVTGVARLSYQLSSVLNPPDPNL